MVAYYSTHFLSYPSAIEKLFAGHFLLLHRFLMQPEMSRQNLFYKSSRSLHRFLFPVGENHWREMRSRLVYRHTSRIVFGDHCIDWYSHNHWRYLPTIISFP